MKRKIDKKSVVLLISVIVFFVSLGGFALSQGHTVSHTLDQIGYFSDTSWVEIDQNNNGIVDRVENVNGSTLKQYEVLCGRDIGYPSCPAGSIFDTTSLNPPARFCWLDSFYNIRTCRYTLSAGGSTLTIEFARQGTRDKAYCGVVCVV